MRKLVNLIDTEAEQRVITSMLNSDNACADAITELEEKDFSDPFNLKVFSSITSLYVKNVKPTLSEVLKEGLQSQLIAKKQDIDRLTQATSQYIDDENIGYWIQQVKTKSKIRIMNAMLDKYKETIATAKDSEATEIISNASDDFSSLSILSADEKIQEPGEVAKLGYDLVVQKMEKYREEKSRNPYGALILDGVPTGIDTLDTITLGYKPGELIILAAKTGDGKTSFALNTVDAVSVKAKQPTLYINTEMSKQQIALRWGCILSGVDHDKIRNGAITNEELSLIAEAYRKLTESQFYPVSIPNLTPSKLYSVAKKAKLRKNVQLIITDYVGRIDTFDPRLQEWQVLYNVVKAQKQMAQNLECACMVLIQLNPDETLQGAKRMENESDLMLKLLPVSEDEVKAYEQEKGIMYENWNYKLEIKKNRDGVAGNSIPLFFNKPTQKITQAVRISK